MMVRTPAALVGLATFAGFVLFHVAFQVTALEEQLSVLNQEIVTDREALHVLHAEWTHLNQPNRLADLSTRYLAMRPIGVAGVGDVDQLPAMGADELAPALLVDGDPLPLPRGKPLSPPRYTVAASEPPATRSSAAQLPVETKREFQDLLVQILQPIPGGT